MSNSNDTKKKSKILSFFKLLFLFLFPFFRVITVIKGLQLSYKVTNDIFFKKAIFRHYIILILTLIPVYLSLFVSYNLVTYDKNFVKRYTAISKDSSILDIASNIKKAIVIQKNDSNSIIKEKKETQVRLLAFKILMIPSVLFYIFLVLLYNVFHPSISKKKKLEKALLRSGFIKEDEPYYVFVSPKGYIIKTEGLNPEDLISNAANKVWAPLNTQVSKFIIYDDDRTVSFFKKSFELPRMIDYNL